MRRFRGPHTLRLIDSAVVRDEHEAGTGAFSRALGNVPTHDVENPRTQKVVYLVLPYFPNGNVQDAINAHIVHKTRFDERKMLQLFACACDALKSMHQYVLPHVSVQAGDEDEDVNTTHAVSTKDDSLLFDAGLSESYAYPPPEPMATNAAASKPLSTSSTHAERVPYAHRDVKPGYVCFPVCSSQLRPSF